MKNENDIGQYELPNIPLATHYFHQKYLYAFAPQAAVQNYVRTQALEEEINQLQEIMNKWNNLRPRISKLIEDEKLSVEEPIQIKEIPTEFHHKIKSFKADPSFQKTFSHLPTSFNIVEIEKLIAPQRVVNLDYVNKLVNSYPKSPSLDDLLDICISPKREMDAIQHLQIAKNEHVFSSPNSDIRYLGSFVRKLTPEDLVSPKSGGIPVAAIITFIGYGGSPINVLKAKNRLILHNGFHRVYALHSLGVTEIPVVVQHVGNVDLEFPPNVSGLPKNYLLNHPRPVLFKDWFVPEFAVTLKIRERMKLVTVGINVKQHEVPS